MTVADIQKDFPNWPDAVIDPWLIEFANDPGMGWPPPEPYGNHRWGRLLGQRPLSWWQNVTWALEKTDCGLSELTPKARADVLDIRKEISGGAPSASTKRRWDNIFRYMLNTGTFPATPLVMRRPEGLSLIDGAHRFAVFSALQSTPKDKFASLKVEKPSLEQEVWTGIHKDGELPNAE
ncbi:hypothetical protein [Bradyrhizobium sp. AUGA SZCCT0431]|uniref:hypothetical protein n=1 Tax=Bradyrhizobium sp. AUGA SZCCT0431 TaxID=2807674 RepID=UPI001BA848FF|nr:hypothetical protein [Bradyrhizobium sp. AUGA SZCCT0431]MBR1143341.1 hypothetical protein [Bradyrhizobium sp. AUGA SZCCT0431]